MDNEDRATSPGSAEYLSTTGTRAARFRSQTIPSFSQPRPQFATHGPDPRMTRGDAVQSASRAHQTSPSAFPAHPLPAQFVPGHFHTPYNSFPPQYVVSIHPPPFQNQLPPTQPYAYHGYRPPESSPYPPSRFFSLPRHQPPPYFPHHPSSAQGGDTSYQQARPFPPPIPQSATSGNPGQSHTGSYGGIQTYTPHLYSSTGHPRSLPQYQPGMYQWYHPLGSSSDTLTEGHLMQVQEHYPIIDSSTQIQRPHRDSDTFRAQPTGSELLLSPRLDPNNNSTPAAGSRHTMSPAAGDSQEHTSEKSSQKLNTHEVSKKSAAAASHAQDHHVRRRYHPNPPPNRSEWVMWIGNIPNDATHDELWRFLKQSASVPSSSEGSSGAGDSGVLSIFLISRSNCAFINYQSEAYLNHAISRFNGRKLRPHDRRCPRLVCRARRKEDDLRAGVGAQRGMGVHTHYVKNVLRKGSESLAAGEESGTPGARRPPASSASKDKETPKSDTVERGDHKVPTQSPDSYASTSSSLLSRHFPKRFFILKSLSRYDLDLSTKRGAWATQKHNEAVLDQAYRTSNEVILIFSVNKSGEFYGYARMASGISRGNRSITWAPRPDSSSSVSSPSNSRVPIHDSPEQPESRQAQMYTSSSDREPVEVSPSRLPPSPDESKDGPSAASSSAVESTKQRQLALAPPVPHRNSAVPDQPPWSRFSSSQGWPQALQTPGPSSHSRPPSGPDPHSARQPLGFCLPPVTEDIRTESSAEEGQPTHTAVPTHGHPEGQERGANWGETFKIEWLSTCRVPFHRTRHLRNPWNHGREIKVSRDGTEVEPGVGQRLIDSWSTLASEPLSGNDARRTTGPARGGRRGGGSDSKPGSSAGSIGVLEEPS